MRFTKNKARRPALVLTLVASLIAGSLFMASCKSPGKKKESLKIVNWNAQTFFDGNNDGIEYSNFVKSKKWNQEAYKERLQKLCKAIQTLDGDLVILEEIENEGIIYDISNALAGASWNPSKVYSHACFAKNKGGSIGCAVLSRRPLEGLKVHSLDIQSEQKAPPSMRPIIEVDLLCPKRLKIFVNHWKSKAGGQDSALWRRWQESLLARKIAERQKEDSAAAILCAGDFNQDIKEFSAASEEGKNIALKSAFSAQEVSLYSPWPDFEEELGSYNFRDKWERIDHFFTCGNLSLSDFSPQKGEWSYDDGRPKPFKIYSLNGWSDHLPISCRLEF